jgi:hypothetical protein
MSRRQLRVLTVLLLGLLLAAPLSVGDQGLWLSLTSSPAELAEIVVGSAPAESLSLAPDRADPVTQTVSASRPERVEGARTLGPAGAAWSLGPGRRWTVPDTAPLHLQGEPFADRPAPRAPPA